MDAASNVEGVVIASTPEWTRGLQRGKMLMGARRRPVTSKPKDDGLSTMGESLHEPRTFTVAQRFPMASTLVMVACKAQLFGLASDSSGLKALGTNLKLVLDGGLVGAPGSAPRERCAIEWQGRRP